MGHGPLGARVEEGDFIAGGEAGGAGEDGVGDCVEDLFLWKRGGLVRFVCLCSFWFWGEGGGVGKSTNDRGGTAVVYVEEVAVEVYVGVTGGLNRCVRGR